MEVLNFTQGDWIIKVIAHYDPEELLQCKQRGEENKLIKSKVIDAPSLAALFLNCVLFLTWLI